jgi:hypothetical protein
MFRYAGNMKMQFDPCALLLLLVQMLSQLRGNPGNGSLNQCILCFIVSLGHRNQFLKGCNIQLLMNKRRTANLNRTNKAPILINKPLVQKVGLQSSSVVDA